MPAGRPNNFSPTAHRNIVEALKLGVTRKGAAAIAGISDRTIRNWMIRGAAGEEGFSEFARDVLAAEANTEMDMTLAITTAARAGDWKAAQVWLERRVLEWRPKTSVNVEEDREQLLDIVEQVLTPEDAEKIYAALAGGTGSQKA